MGDATTKKKNKEFQRFEDFTRKLVSVPKEEIQKREQAEKDKKNMKRLSKTA
jgi:hypothetical protein